MVGFDQAVHDFRQFLAFDSEFAGCSAPAERQHDCMRAVLILGSRHREDPVRFLADVRYSLARAGFEVGPLHHFLPECQQIFLRKFRLVELPIQREFDRPGENQFLSRVFRNRSPDLILLQGDVVELALDGAQRGADAGRTGAHDQDVINFPNGSGVRLSLASLPDDVDAFPPLVDRVFDQCQAAEFSDDKQVGDARLVFWRQIREVGTYAGTRHHHGDGADRASFGADTMSNALMRIDDHRFAAEYSQHVAFGTHFRARAATDAVAGIDVRVLRLWPFGVCVPLRSLARPCFFSLVAPDVEQQRDSNDKDVNK